MAASLDKVFEYCRRNLLLADRIIIRLRMQNYDSALRLIKEQVSVLEQLLEVFSECEGYFNAMNVPVNREVLFSVIQEAFEVLERKDYVYLADLYEAILIPDLLHLQEAVITKEGLFVDNQRYLDNIEAVRERDPELGELLYDTLNQSDINNGRMIEFTSYGDYTLAYYEQGTDKKYYIHSNTNVWKEADYLAESWYSPEKINYIIYGLGLGYHVFEMASIDEGINVEVYESDLNIIHLACQYSPIKLFLSKCRIKIIYDPSHSRLRKRIGEMDNETEFVVHYPMLRSERNEQFKEWLENYFIQFTSIKNQSRIMNGNFLCNRFHYDGLIDELKDEFMNRDLYIIAAGPSLDKNYLQLKMIGQKGIILAAGTVFRKLLSAGIRPDYFIVTDANERVYKQIAGLEKESIPMLFLSTAYKGFANKYQGKKYMILQEGYDKAEEFAIKCGASLIQTGGSVSTTALDLGITFGCRRIIFLGLDLAYTGNVIHASDTSIRELKMGAGLRQVEDIDGNLIATSKVLDMYRQWIEKRISNVKETEFINASEGGANIKGMKNMKLMDIIEEYSSMERLLNER